MEKTKEHMTKNMEWRRKVNVNHIRKQDPEDVLGCSFRNLLELMPHWQFRYDREMHPVLYYQIGRYNITDIKNATGGSFDSVVKYHVWEQEALTRLCAAQTRKTGFVVDSVTAVVDLQHLSMQHASRDSLNMAKLLIEIDNKQSPETLGSMLISKSIRHIYYSF